MKSATALLAITLAVFAVSAARAATHDDATQIVMPRSIVTERTLAGYRNGDPGSPDRSTPGFFGCTLFSAERIASAEHHHIDATAQRSCWCR